ncbi:ABC transporter ATP-binding protein [Mycolicibacterium wolinskyi]|uniref:ABC transporter ATP-binding protein n=1 Tax=Mycolicibacterium wolinskyi TaxID=59750 RepID=UPI00391771F8
MTDTGLGDVSVAGLARRRFVAKEPATPAVVFDRVGVSYGRGARATPALIDFSLRVAPGETVALLGPSGAGKSTALRALAGVVRPSSGTLWAAGRDITGLPPVKRGIGVVLQSSSLFPHMRVADNVAFGLRAQRVPRREIEGRVAEALGMTDMTSYGRCFPRELSDVQQLHASIARALAIRPTVLLLDEPLATLDVQLRQSVLVELQQLKKTLPDIAMLYVTHDPAEALALADRIAVMADGRLVDVDKAEILWKRPPTTYTATFLGGANLLPCTVGRVIGTSALVTVANRTVSAEAPQPAVGRIDWAPGSAALLCIRPHALQVVSLGNRDALRATVNAAIWRGATTRLVASVNQLPDHLIEVDVPGHARFEVGSEVGVRIPEPAGVLVRAG